MKKRIQKEKSCGIIPFKKNRESFLFLIVLQNNGDWSFPKGHTEIGESCEETALREFFEETGLEIEKLFHQKSFSFSFQKEYPDYILDKEVVLYLAEVKDGDPQLQEEEIRDYAWLGKDEILERFVFDEIKKSFLSAIDSLPSLISEKG